MSCSAPVRRATPSAPAPTASGNDDHRDRRHDPNKTTGHLNLTTVSVTEESHKETIIDVLSAWQSSDQVVIPKSVEYPPGQSEDQVNQQNADDFTQSQDNAVAASSCELGYPQQTGIADVLSSGAAFGKLKPADVITRR